MRIPIIAPWIVYTMVSVALGLILLRISIHLVRRQERI
jgi:hypothetical protein